ncbi:hypothetical protein HPB50_015411 [Hyalomma asiaticum]|uniref:Uncharacterized protein n=1 Tax=Hyalomma asiaticum TaxID=266040 RepID=A0ACB7S374_HYAAI|nr:hypothetical protein HPB50_015411 [Hyalomma asiaticum]
MEAGYTILFFGGVLLRLNLVASLAPVTFTWSKNGARLRETDGLSIQETKLVSLLVIQRTETSSRGNYTCRASNVVGADEHTAELIVEAPPVWRSEPQGVSAVSGSNVSVHCTASGSPPPKITWTRTKDGGSTILPTENGQLFIHNVRVSEAGTYSCKAENGVGSAIEKSIRVTISGTLSHSETIEKHEVAVTSQVHSHMITTLSEAAGTFTTGANFTSFKQAGSGVIYA